MNPMTNAVTESKRYCGCVMRAGDFLDTAQVIATSPSGPDLSPSIDERVLQVACAQAVRVAQRP